jgi:hypothetical protein
MAVPVQSTQPPASEPAPRVGRVGAYAEGTTKKVSVSLDLQALEWAQERARAQGKSLSSVVSEVLNAARRWEAMDDWLADAERTHGPVPEEIQREVDAELRAAGVIR